MPNPTPPLDVARAVLAATRDPWALLFRVQLETGARYGELAHLLGVHVLDGQIRIEPHPLPDGSTWRPKSPAGVRTICVGPAVGAELASVARAVGPDRLLFFPNKTRPTQVRTANDVLERTARRVGAPPFSTHALRRLRIVQALAAGADPNSVRAAVGHRGLATTVGYLKDVPIKGELPPLDAEPVDAPVAAQYMFLARKKGWK